MSNVALIRVPKSGSTTLLRNLQRARNDHPCITHQHRPVSFFAEHGHAHDFITMVRDPLQQAVSCYYYVRNVANAQRMRDPNGQANLGVLAEHRILSEGMTLDEYLFTAPANDFAGKYFETAQPSDFAVVGVTNEMAASLALVTAITGIPTQERWDNKNPARPETLQPYYVDPAVAAEFKTRNAIEYDLYNKGVEHFEFLKAKWL